MNFTLPPHRFEVGDKATYILWSDCNAGYIIAVSDGDKRVQFQYAKAKLLNGPQSNHPERLSFTVGGFCGHTEGKQIYRITPDVTGKVIEFSLRKNGLWKLARHPYKSPREFVDWGSQSLL